MFFPIPILQGFSRFFNYFQSFATRSFLFLFFLAIGNIYTNAQDIFTLIYSEWSDGCLTYEARGHTDTRGQHRNDNAFVKSEIDRFWNLARQYDATEYKQGQHNAGDYVYNIVSELNFSRELYKLISYHIFQVGDSKTTTSFFSSDGSLIKGFSFGYNYTYKIPIGVTLGLNNLYASFNIGFGDSGISYDSDIDDISIQLEWFAGYTIPVNSFFRIPVGIGFNHTQMTNNNEIRHKFSIEAGLKLIILDFLYLCSTYRLIGLSRSGFSIGAGFIF